MNHRLKASIAQALEARDLKDLPLRFDATVPGSRASEQQQAVFADLGIVRHRYLVAANQCLAAGTLVATPRGAVPIEQLKVGDLVIDELGQPVEVIATFDNGIKRTYPLVRDGKEILRCTPEHRLVDVDGEMKEARELKGYYELDKKKAQHETVHDIRVNSPTNLYQLTNGIITHNCGKTQIGVRELAWVLREDHPFWTRPERWGNESLLLMVIGNTRQGVEENIIRKLMEFFPNKGELKVKRTGGQVQSIQHKKTKNKVIFLSHDNVKQARERSQGFVCHWVWVDEMPNSMEFINEIQMRVRDREGYFLATFTPLIKNDAIRKYVDGLETPIGRKYQLDFLANPKNHGREREILAAFANQPESIKRTRLYGDWSTGEGTVFMYDPSLQVRPLPPNYGRDWEHVEASDPATQTKFGFLLFTRDPSTGLWYMIFNKYIQHLYAPSEIVKEVIRLTHRFNVVRRVADGHEGWYLGEARKQGLSYVTPNKRDRKKEMIGNLQEALGNWLFITPECEAFIEEIVEASWNEDGTSILKGSTYHLLDAAQYFVDRCPVKPKAAPVPVSFHERIYRENEAWQAKKRTEEKKSAGRQIRHVVQYSGRRGRPQTIRRSR